MLGSCEMFTGTSTRGEGWYGIWRWPVCGILRVLAGVMLTLGDHKGGETAGFGAGMVLDVRRRKIWDGWAVRLGGGKI